MTEKDLNDYLPMVSRCANIENVSLTKPLLMLRAGHGGREPGAVVGNLKEHTVNSVIARLLFNELKEIGIPCIHLNYESEDLSNWLLGGIGVTMDIQRELKAPVFFLSIHCNSYKSERANGCEVLYMKDSFMKQYAEALSKQMASATGMRNRGAKARKNLAELNVTWPALIAECGFLTNPDDRMILLQHPKRVARGILTGILTMYL